MHLPLRFSCAALKGIQPRERLEPLAGPPAELALFKLISPGGKLSVDPLNGFRADAIKVLRRPGGQLVQIKVREPLGSDLQRAEPP